MRKIFSKNNFRILGIEIKKHAPEIMTGVGVVSCLAGFGMAVRAGLKTEELVDICKDRIAEVKENKDDKEVYATEKEYKKDLVKAYMKNVGDIAGLYGPAIMLEIGGIASVFGATVTFKKRGMQLVAEAATWEGMYKNLKDKLVEKYGPELAKEIEAGVEVEKVTEEITDENGKTKKVKKDIKVTKGLDEKYSTYSRFYDSSVRGWDKNPGINKDFLLAVNAWANNKLDADGFLLLSDVYKAIGFDETIASKKVGWLKEHYKSVGDGYVSFGLFDNESWATRRFTNELEPTILLDFNVDGDLFDNPDLHDDLLRILNEA